MSQKKGFRAKKVPSKGEVQKENNALTQRLQVLEQGLQQMAPMIYRQSQELQQIKSEQIASIDLIRFDKVTEASQNGDKVMIDFFGRLINEDGTPGDAFNGGSGRGYTFELGSGNLIEDLESQLVGKKAGDVCQLKVTFPEEYREDLKGQTVFFDVEVIKVFRKNYSGDVIALINEYQEEERKRAEEQRAKTLEEQQKVAETEESETE